MSSRGRQLPEPRAKSQSFLRKLRGKDSGKLEEPLRDDVLLLFRLETGNSYIELIHIYLSSSRKFFLSSLNKNTIIRKLPLPEIFYNNNEFEIIENLSDKEEDDSENQEEHER